MDQGLIGRTVEFQVPQPAEGLCKACIEDPQGCYKDQIGTFRKPAKNRWFACAEQSSILSAMGVSHPLSA